MISVTMMRRKRSLAAAILLVGRAISEALRTLLAIEAVYVDGVEGAGEEERLERKQACDGDGDIAARA